MKTGTMGALAFFAIKKMPGLISPTFPSKVRSPSGNMTTFFSICRAFTRVFIVFRSPVFPETGRAFNLVIMGPKKKFSKRVDKDFVLCYILAVNRRYKVVRQRHYYEDDSLEAEPTKAWSLIQNEEGLFNNTFFA